MVSDLRRSWMFVPGHTARFVEKAAGVPADTVFLDLEDGVPVAEKAAARRLVVEVLDRPDFKPRRFVRLNSMVSPWFDDDLKAVVVPGLDGVCLPKVESATEVLRLASCLHELERQRSMGSGTVRVVAAVESACGLLAAPAIAASHSRVEALMFGAEDFALDLGLGTHRSGESRELIHARSSLVVAAASARVGSIDGVFPDLDDPEGLAADILQARRLGFTGKSTFNPRQLDVINREFSPSPDEIDYAKKVVAAFEDAQSRGEGSVAVGGQLVDLPIVMRAKRLLEASALVAMTSRPSEPGKDATAVTFDQ
jgi:citrate lyase subunit beta / citryl-CoA lyase